MLTNIMARLEPEIKQNQAFQRFAKGQSKLKTEQLELELLGSQEVVSPYLQVTSVPLAERIDPKENRYMLLILPAGVRAAGAQLTADEAHEVAKATKGWNWSLDKNGRLRCLARLEGLLDSICKPSFKEGGAV
jgi:hypothetical protein